MAQLINNAPFLQSTAQMYQYANPPPYTAPLQQFGQKKHIFNAPPKKSNALFIKNLPYAMSSDEFLNVFKQFGEIASSSLHIQNRGIAFVTFFDIRSAEAAVNGLRNFTAYGRHPVIDYSYKPPNYSKIDPRVYSSLVKVVSNKPLKMDEIKNEFSKFGEISEIKEIDNKTFEVNFYDLRKAHEACKNGKIVLNGAQCKLEIFVENDNSVIYNNFNNNINLYNYNNNNQQLSDSHYQQSSYQIQPPSPPIVQQNMCQIAPNPSLIPRQPLQQIKTESVIEDPESIKESLERLRVLLFPNK